jgi:WD40 repeat protein
VWDTDEQELVGEFTPEDGMLISCLLGPDGNRLLTLAGLGFARRSERSATLWDVNNNRQIAQIADSVAGTFSPDGNLVATGGMDSAVHLLDALTGEELYSLSHEAEVRALDFDPTSQFLATATRDGTVRIWDVLSGQEMTILNHGIEIYSVMFSADGSRLIAHDANRNIFSWIVSTEELVSIACQMLTRNLTLEEWDAYVGSTVPYQETCPR